MIKAESLLGLFCSNKRDFCVVLALPWTHVRHFPPYPNADHCWPEGFDLMVSDYMSERGIKNWTTKLAVHICIFLYGDLRWGKRVQHVNFLTAWENFKTFFFFK